MDGIGWRSALEGRRCSGNEELKMLWDWRCRGCVNSVNIKEVAKAVPGWPLGSEAGEQKSCIGCLAEGWQGPRSHSPSANTGFAFLPVDLMEQSHYGHIRKGIQASQN